MSKLSCFFALCDKTGHKKSLSVLLRLEKMFSPRKGESCSDYYSRTVSEFSDWYEFPAFINRINEQLEEGL